MKKIILATMFVAGCATPVKQETFDMSAIGEQITVTHRILVPGLNQYCEVDSDKFKIKFETCTHPATVYSESEE